MHDLTTLNEATPEPLGQEANEHPAGVGDPSRSDNPPLGNDPGIGESTGLPLHTSRLESTMRSPPNRILEDLCNVHLHLHSHKRQQTKRKQREGDNETPFLTKW